MGVSRPDQAMLLMLPITKVPPNFPLHSLLLSCSGINWKDISMAAVEIGRNFYEDTNMMLLFRNRRQGNISLARTGPKTPLRSNALFFRPTVESRSLRFVAQLAENSHKFVGKLLYILPGLAMQVTVTSSPSCCSACSGGRGVRDSHPVPKPFKFHRNHIMKT